MSLFIKGIVIEDCDLKLTHRELIAFVNLSADVRLDHG